MTHFRETEEILQEFVNENFPTWKTSVEFNQVGFEDIQWLEDKKNKTILFNVYFGASRDGRLWLEEMLEDMKFKKVGRE